MRKVVISLLLFAASTGAFAAGRYRQLPTCDQGSGAFISPSNVQFGLDLSPRRNVLGVHARAAIVNAGDFDGQDIWWRVRITDSEVKTLFWEQDYRAEACHVARGVSVLHFDRDIPTLPGSYAVGLSIHTIAVHGDPNNLIGETLDGQAWKVLVN
jgi:hypothetical protein